jgi:hypothetical protein
VLDRFLRGVDERKEVAVRLQLDDRSEERTRAPNILMLMGDGDNQVESTRHFWHGCPSSGTCKVRHGTVT